MEGESSAKQALALPPEPFNRVRNILYGKMQTGDRLARVLFRLAAAGYSTARYLVLNDRPPLYFHERVVEIPWAIDKARELPSGARILEIGDVMGETFASLGYRVVTVDLAPPRESTTRGWTYKRADARHFESSELFDAAFSISTLEHIGIGHYGDPVDPVGDRATVSRINSLLRQGGRLFFSVPYGPTEKTTWLRTYDTRSLSSLVQGWTSMNLEVFIFDKWRWRSSSNATDLERAARRLSMHTAGIALVSATK